MLRADVLIGDSACAAAVKICCLAMVEPPAKLARMQNVPVRIDINRNIDQRAACKTQTYLKQECRWARQPGSAQWAMANMV